MNTQKQESELTELMVAILNAKQRLNSLCLNPLTQELEDKEQAKEINSKINTIINEYSDPTIADLKNILGKFQLLVKEYEEVKQSQLN